MTLHQLISDLQAATEGSREEESAMADRPIPFSPAMIRAILDGRKSMTRRLLKVQPSQDVVEFVKVATVKATGRPVFDMVNCFGRPIAGLPVKHGLLDYHYIAPHGVGYRLWVREAWRTESRFNHLPPRDIPRDAKIEYLADGKDVLDGKYRHGRFMCRWMSRITLTVTEVRVQRLQDISEADAIAEGAGLYVPGHGFITTDNLRDDPGYSNYLSPIMGVQCIWTGINGPGSWEANPWVAAYSFDVHPANIDSMEQPHETE